MKKFLLILITAAFTMTACEPMYEPEANFEVSTSFAGTYENVYFYNNSKHAEIYDWDFGDGYYSSTREPVHYYTQPGLYEVTLKAFNGDMVSEMYMTVEVYEPAALDIQVLEFYNKYPVAGASVRLYRTFADWEQELNLVAEGTTNSNGIVFFDDLFPGYYYMDIWHTTHDNFGFANTQFNVEKYIRTPRAYGGEITSFPAYVEYVGATKSATKLRRVKKVEITTNTKSISVKK